MTIMNCFVNICSSTGRVFWIPMLEAPYKNNGFVKGTFESTSKNATLTTSYQHLAIYNHVILDGPVDLSSEALRIAFVPILILLHTYNEILRIPCLTSIRNWAKSVSGGPGPESAPRGTKSTTFAKGFFQPFNLRFFYNPAKGSFGFAHSMSDIPMKPRCSLRSFRNWRLVCSELHINTDFEIYGSSIGVCNYVIRSNPIHSSKSNKIESINPSIKSNQSINQIKLK